MGVHLPEIRQGLGIAWHGDVEYNFTGIDHLTRVRRANTTRSGDAID
jgi:hypothetical protein